MEVHQIAGLHRSRLDVVSSISSIPMSLTRTQSDGWAQLLGSRIQADGRMGRCNSWWQLHLKAALHPGRGKPQLLVDGCLSLHPQLKTPFRVNNTNSSVMGGDLRIQVLNLTLLERPNKSFPLSGSQFSYLQTMG